MNRDMSLRRGFGAAFALAGAVGLAGAAHAGILGHAWVEVDNSVFFNGNATGLNDGAHNGTIYRTFDLYVNVGQGVLVADSGDTQSGGPNSGILIQNTSFFQFNPGGSPSNAPPLQGFLPLFPHLEFDSYVALGDTPPAQIGLTGLGQGFVFDTDELSGTWFTSQGSPASPEGNGNLFVARFTVESTSGFGTDESASRFLGGQLYVALADGNTTGVLDISNAFATSIPAPGALALAALAGLNVIRRRRG